MIDRLLSSIAPHLCCACGEIGTLLCDSCKYNIIDDEYSGCIACGMLAGVQGVCGVCRVPYQRAWCVGERSGELRKLIDEYKFHSARAAYRPLADLLHRRIAQLPINTVVVAVPTTPAHIRQRGYDHTRLVARAFARARGLSFQQPLRRRTTTTQRGANRVQRATQAKAAFAVDHSLDPECPYLLIDDIVTTGATLHYAAEALRAAGARDVWVAAIARQPLD
jgi:ComF family protein